MFENYLVRITRFSLFAALIGPIITSTIFLYPFIAPSTFLFQIFIEIAALGFLALIIINPIYQPRLNKITIFLTLFLIVQFLLVFFSEEPLRSFMGSAERMDGVWNLFHYYLFIIISLSLKQQEKFIKNLVVFSLIVSALVSLRYILFNVGFPLNYFTFSFGNPGFLANYILLHIPLAVWIFTISNNREQKIALLFLILIHSGVIIHTGNRAAFLAWLIGVILLIGYFVFKTKKIRVPLITAILVLTLGFGTLIAIRDTSFVKKFGFLQKITNWSLNDANIKSRLIMWNAALKGIAEKPFFGWGRENFRLIYDKYYDPLFFTFNSQEQWLDKAHNIVLDELVAGGFINGLTEIILILLLLGMLVKLAINNSGKRTFAVIFLIFIFINLLQSLFTLNTLGIYLPFSLGLIVVFSQISTIQNQVIPKIKTGKVLAYISLPLFIGGIILFTLIPLLANYYVAQSLFLFPKDFVGFSKQYKQLDAIMDDKNPYKAEVLTGAGMTFSGKAEPRLLDPRLPPFQNLMLEKLSLAVKQHPRFSRLKTDYAYNLNLKAKRTKDPVDIQNAIRVWDQLLEEFPKNQFIKIGAAGAYIRAKNNNKAINIIYEIINSSAKNGKMYWDSALVFYQAGKTKEAADFFTEALKLNYKPATIVEIVLVGDFLLQFPDKIPFVRDLYLIGISMYPADPNLHANLAYIYGKLGEKQLAIEEARKALQYAPEHQKDIEKFIKNLDQ